MMVNKIQGPGIAVIFAAVLFLCWWKGIFLPNWVDWKIRDYSYEEAQVQLANHHMELVEEQQDGTLGKVYQTPWDWNVQEALPFDINHDGTEELILLVWKHGSYGNHRPIWEKHNDIRLEQHIFIYQWDKTRVTKLRPVWMSSALGYEVTSITRGERDGLIVTDRNDNSKVWKWEDFGLVLAGEAKEMQVSFLAAGDNLIHTSLLQDKRDGYDYLYDHVREEVQQADLASLNQETVFVKDHGLISDYPHFGTPIEVGDAIVKVGFDIVTLANNHILDKELYGVKVTTSFYKEQEGMTYVGVNPPKHKTAPEITDLEQTVVEETAPEITASEQTVVEEAAPEITAPEITAPEITAPEQTVAEERTSAVALNRPEEAVKFVNKNGIRIALLNYTYGTNGIPSPTEYPYLVERFRDEERMLQQIDYARVRADAVIVFAHWGTEYSLDVDEEQQRISDLLLEHEVDVVIGTHPHVLQPYEIRTGADGHQMLIYYSLGNLVSGQDKPECQIGGLAKFNIIKAPNGSVSIQDAELKEIQFQR